MISLSNKIAELIHEARMYLARKTNTAMIYTYFQIGKLIVEELQQGEKRAEYGIQLLESVSTDLSQKFGKGFSVQNLERMRNFFLIYSNSSKELRNSEIFLKSSKELRISTTNNEAITLLPISWSHYLFLMRMNNENERQFYEVESFVNQWTLKELERQFNSGLFERLA